MTSFTSEAEKNFITQLKSFDCYLHFEFGKTYKAKCNVDLENNEIWGESAFTTGMSGYEETITDPSFLGQHIIFSAAHIGNYETKENVIQSDKIHCTAIIARNISYSPILASLKNKNIPLISDLDTRSIVRAMVRNPGKHLTCLSHSPQPPKSFRKDLLITDDLHRVSTAKKLISKEQIL
jgi:carbamoyl-phosphate synthase large subunit